MESPQVAQQETFTYVASVASAYILAEVTTCSTLIYFIWVIG